MIRKITSGFLLTTLLFGAGCSSHRVTALDAVSGKIETGVALEGGTRSLSRYSGKVVLVNVWSTWCKQCAYEMSVLNVIHKRFNSRGFQILSVLVGDSIEKGRAFVQENHIEFPVLVDNDGSFQREMGIQALPVSFLIGCSGEYLRRFDAMKSGNQSFDLMHWEEPQAIELLEGLLDESQCRANQPA